MTSPGRSSLSPRCDRDWTSLIVVSGSRLRKSSVSFPHGLSSSPFTLCRTASLQDGLHREVNNNSGRIHVSESLEFGYGSSVGNNSVFGAPKSWAMAKDGAGVNAAYRGYRKHRGFFDVIWQINVPKPPQPHKPESARKVRLQVESPTYDKDPSLNTLKREVIKAL